MSSELGTPVGGASVQDRRAVLAAARVAIDGLAGLLWQVTGPELAQLVEELEALSCAAGGAVVAVVAEADARGEIAASQAGTGAQWVARHAPSLAAEGAGQVARLVQECRRPELAPVRDAVERGRLPVGVGLTVVSEFRALRPMLHGEARPTVLDGLLQMGAEHGRVGVRRLRPAMLARFGDPGVFQEVQDSAGRLVALSRPVGDELGAFTYRLVLDAHGKAALEAAIGPLSAPAPEPDGSRDPRPPERRRGEALIEVCRRAAAVGGGGIPPSGVKSTLLVTMPFADLAARLGAGEVLGSSEVGALLAPETVRRLACDAGVIPVVLGAESEILDLGRLTRLFSRGQTAALWLRDRVCTFPGCSTPAHWCDAHHLIHWVDGGASDLSNAALLCGRHHTVVHRDRLFGWVAADGVQWDRCPGSYDRALERSGPRQDDLAGPAPPAA